MSEPVPTTSDIVAEIASSHFQVSRALDTATRALCARDADIRALERALDEIAEALGRRAGDGSDLEVLVRRVVEERVALRAGLAAIAESDPKAVRPGELATKAHETLVRGDAIRIGRSDAEKEKAR